MTAADPCMILLFGATGDLAERKLAPALFHLFKSGVVTARTPIIGIARARQTREEFIASLHLSQTLPRAKPAELEAFAALLHYEPFAYTAEDAPRFVAATEAIERATQCGPNRLLYLALPAAVFAPTVDTVRAAGLFQESGWKRVIFEKPFGTDLASARELNRQVTALFREEEIYRIDHYLGKEIVRNILVFRFANPIFDQIWSTGSVDHVQITIGETLGVEGRGKYYEKSGAIRDMLQNHILQVLALAAMEQPRGLDAEAIRDAAVRSLLTLIPPRREDIVVGQYGRGRLGDVPLPAYREEDGIAPGSATETFVAMRLEFNHPRWRGVPFYVRTGKRLAKKVAEINVVLRPPGWAMVHQLGIDIAPNVITLRIQPHEGISLEFNVKEPGEELRLVPQLMEYCHHCLYALNTPEAYEILLGQALHGDQTLFTRWDFVEASWEFIEPVFAMVEEQRFEFPNYAAGTFGPEAAAELIGRAGREWIVSRDIAPAG